MEQKRQKETSMYIQNNRVKAIENLRIARARELKRKLEMVKDEIQRRKDGLQKEIEGIKASKELSEDKKERLIGQAMQRPIVSPEFIGVMLEICDKLDKLMVRIGHP